MPFSVSYIPSSFVKTEDYVFVHIASFTKSNADYLALNFDSERCRCTGRGCADKCYTISKCNLNGGVVNGRDCYMCGKSERWDNANRRCVPNCRENEEQDYDGDSCICKFGYTRAFAGDICKVQCPNPNEVWTKNNGCVCREGCGRHGGSCIPCPANSRVLGSTCVCDKLYNWNSFKYTCDFLNCPANSSPQLNETSGLYYCKCDNSYYWNNYTSLCQYVATCPQRSRMDYDNSKNMWKCFCERDYLWNDRKYLCDYLICPGNSTAVYVNDTWSCQCNKDFYSNEIRKTCDFIICPSRSKPGFVNGNLTCICD